jgi:hypothetical protein
MHVFAVLLFFALGVMGLVSIGDHFMGAVEGTWEACAVGVGIGLAPAGRFRHVDFVASPSCAPGGSG